MTDMDYQQLAKTKIKNKHFLTLDDYTQEEIQFLIDYAIHLKQLKKAGTPHQYLEGKTLAMIFEKSSMRTRVSFEAAMYHLGGHAMFISKDEIQVGKRETIPDTAKVLSRFVDGIMIRTFGHEIVEGLSESASIPVINGLTDQYHPCQVLADLITLQEKKGSLAGHKLVYVGDGNNMAHSLLYGCATMGIDCTIAVPKGYEVDPAILEKAEEKAKLTGATIVQTNDPVSGITNADVVYTDVWASMGFEDSAEERKEAFAQFQVNETLLANANEDVLFFHCLPAHRDEEVSAGVIDGKHSVVFDQAENRLHAHKAILATLLAE
ncbi:MAG TPA: ornithine carbamoyltransferase [Candidatus Avamphibacillus intestinigallinarum]|nr:ornithine carbamoyltransferase [Candidatus Avamphibacillus intestinigallinarum]